MKSKIHIQSYFDIYKQPWSVVIFINSEKNDGFNFSSHSWNPFKDVEKQCHGRPAIGGHLTNQFCQRGGGQGQDFQHISHNQILSFFLDFCRPSSKKSILPRRKMRISTCFTESDHVSKRPTLQVELSVHLRFDKTMDVGGKGKICQNISTFLMILFLF